MEHGPELAYLAWCARNRQVPDMHPEFFTRMMDKLIKDQRLGMSVILKHDFNSYTRELVMFARIGDDKYRDAGARQTPYDTLIESRYNKNMGKENSENKKTFNETEDLHLAKTLTSDVIDADISANGDKSF